MLVDFYHLTTTPLERVLPRICERVLTDGGRLLVVAEAQLIPQLDTQLWGYAREAFLPHGRSDGPAPERQLVLLSPEVKPLNGATNVALADGLWRDEALSFERTFFFFDADRVDAARLSWKSVKTREDAQPRYWKQDAGGKWVQAA